MQQLKTHLAELEHLTPIRLVDILVITFLELSKNQLLRHGSEGVAPVAIPALVPTYLRIGHFVQFRLYDITWTKLRISGLTCSWYFVFFKKNFNRDGAKNDSVLPAV